MADLLRVSILGALPGGEKWSINPVFAFSVGQAVSSEEAAAAAAAVNTVSPSVNLLSYWPNTVSLTGCRVEARNATGELESVGEAIRGTPVVGQGSVTHPVQTAIVLSLRTTDSSARGKGRLYWPATGFPLAPATLRFTATAVGDFLTGMNAYLAGIRTALDGVSGLSLAPLAVWSRENASTRVVLSLRAGDVPDVQRRRRDSLVETYTSQAVTAP